MEGGGGGNMMRARLPAHVMPLSLSLSLLHPPTYEEGLRTDDALFVPACVLVQCRRTVCDRIQILKHFLFHQAKGNFASWVYCI